MKPSEQWVAALVRQNQRQVERAGAADVGELVGRGGSVPRDHLTVLTCMDVRIDPLRVFGWELGQVHILRNAGARVTEDVIRSLVISQQALGTTRVLLMPHTRCGVLNLDPTQLTSQLGAGPRPPLDFRTMTDLAEAVRGDVQTLRASPWIPESVEVAGAILDIDTGQVVPVAG